MFNCDLCGRKGVEGQPEQLVLRVREARYPERRYWNKGRPVVDPGGRGIETVKTALSCGCIPKGALKPELVVPVAPIKELVL